MSERKQRPKSWIKLHLQKNKSKQNYQVLHNMPFLVERINEYYKALFKHYK